MPSPSPTTAPERRDPFLRAYRSLRFDLTTDVRRPGDQIVVTETARSLAMSPTPVREALARLSGEGLVEDRRHHGYFVPLPSWFDLLELYALCELHLGSALRDAIRAGRRVPDPGPTEPPTDATRSALSEGDPFAIDHCMLLSLSRNSRLVASGRLILDSLAAARRAENRLFDDGPARAAELRDLIRASAWKEALPFIRRDFSVRRRRAEAVAHALVAGHRAKNRPDIV